MKYEDFSEDDRHQIGMLHYGSLTIEAEVNDAMEQAEDLNDFQERVDTLMDKLINEAKTVKGLLGSGNDKEKTKPGGNKK